MRFQVQVDFCKMAIHSPLSLREMGTTRVALITTCKSPVQGAGAKGQALRIKNYRKAREMAFNVGGDVEFDTVLNRFIERGPTPLSRAFLPLES
jgi:hypothetical protein